MLATSKFFLELMNKIFTQLKSCCLLVLLEEEAKVVSLANQFSQAKSLTILLEPLFRC